ncbi:PAXIP1-associated glutamate-rich protein 1A-like [Argiope bruennichi]|uniref:PAXIP1-associated glutamate-rich protein 1 like protein n=1 Tax=Argiope bruennichi TaxID=94029 RepID=A0A8T0EGJ2_ARGBR|nr:PAXIP1-associated glutamate-rich protein 1A-like [Argiope bruennichi]KAF8772962.1 PAXIP1-associated glutamate-rich protein 1 like protein [Argiope bruennichi]
MEENNLVPDDWSINCSDDELSTAAKDSNDMWEPSPEEIISMYEILESKGVLEFEWQCPGRRSPSVNSMKSDLMDKGPASNEDSKLTAEPNEFDFNDEFSTEQFSPKISARNRAKQATSAQRRVARLDKVMFDIQRHRKLDELELQKSSPQSSNSPGSKASSNDNKT